MMILIKTGFTDPVSACRQTGLQSFFCYEIYVKYDIISYVKKD